VELQVVVIISPFRAGVLRGPLGYKIVQEYTKFSIYSLLAGLVDVRESSSYSLICIAIHSTGVHCATAFHTSIDVSLTCHQI